MNPLTPHEIREDLFESNDGTADYTYEYDPSGFMLIKHYGDDGELIGTQTLTFNLGKYEAIA